MAEDRTLGQLVSDASRDLSELVRYEMALAKAELRDDLKRGATAGGLFGVAGFLSLLSLIALLIAAGLGLAEFMPAWLAFLVVAATLLLTAGLLALVGKSQIGRIKPPERTIRSTRATIAAVRGRGNGSVAAGGDQRGAAQS
jgi:hypothetical protein